MEGRDADATGNGAGDYAPRDQLNEQRPEGRVTVPGAAQDPISAEPAPSAGVADEVGAGDGPSDAADRLRAAARTAEYLVELLRDLEREAGSAEEQGSESEDHGRELAELRDNVREAALDGLSGDGLQSMGDLVEALVKKPSDLLVMVKLSEQAETLAAIIRSHKRVLAIVEEDPSPPDKPSPPDPHSHPMGEGE